MKTCIGSNTRITLSILISFSIAFTTFFLIIDSFEPPKHEMSCLSDDLRKKIFILGSSHVGNLDTNFIDDYVSKYDVGGEYSVYNLAIGGDIPRSRINELEQIISAKPALVVYGLGYRSFDGQTTFPIHPLFDTRQFFHDFTSVFFKNFIPYDFINFENPKLTILYIIKTFSGQIEQICNESNTPFYNPITNETIKSKYELKREVGSGGTLVNKINPSEDEKVHALKKIITDLQKNNIKVVLLITPFSQPYLDSIPDSQKQIFHSIIKNISKEFNVKIYSLEDKYSDLNIWSNPTHIAFNKDSIVYSTDVAKIILGEIDP